MNPKDNIIQFNQKRTAAPPPEPSESPEKEEKKKIPHVLDLPDGLRKRVLKQYLTAVLLAFCVVLATIHLREPGFLIGFLLSGYLIYLGIMTSLDYVEGKIIEMAVLCASVNSFLNKRTRFFSKLQNTSRVVFRTVSDSDDHIPEYFEFLLPGSVNDDLVPNYAYIIYFDPLHPKELLGYTPI